MNVAATILVVEDEAIIAMSLRRELVRAGFSVGKAIATGEDAILRAEHEKPDLVLMDCHLSGRIDGLEAALRIRENSEIPVIFMTGYPQDEAFIEKSRLVNPFGILIKPVRFRDLKAMIDVCLGK